MHPVARVGAVAAIESLGMRPTSLAVAVVSLLFLLYNANGRVISDGDSTSSRYLPFATWSSGSLSLDSVSRLATEVPPGKPYHEPYWTWRSPDGRLFSAYPIVVPVLLTPLYAPAVAMLRWRGWVDWRLRNVSRVMEKLCASLLAAISAGFVFLLLRRRLSTADSLLMTAAYAVGTSVWTIASQALWQHGAAVCLLAFALWAATGKATRANLVAAGAACGLLCVNRPPDALLAGGILIAVLWTRGARSLLFIAAAAAAAAPFLIYNLIVFGLLSGGYGATGLAGSHVLFGRSLLKGVAGLLASPAKGLFVFSPFFLFGFLRPSPAPERFERRLQIGLIAGAAAQLLFYSSTDWRGGACYGPRFLCDAFPVLVWLLAPVVPGLRRAERLVFVSLVLCAVAIQAIGAFCYPEGGSDHLYYPPGAPRQTITSSVWKWRDAAFLVEPRGGIAPPNLWIR